MASTIERITFLTFYRGRGGGSRGQYPLAHPLQGPCRVVVVMGSLTASLTSLATILSDL